MRAVGSHMATAVVVSIFLGPYPMSVVAQTSADAAFLVLAATREALGGAERLAGVRSFVATGRTRQVQDDKLLPIEFQMSWEGPDKYVRTDEFPTQDRGPMTTGFNGTALIQNQGGGAQVTLIKEDLARLMLGLFAGSVSSVSLSFAYAGVAEAPQGQADVLDATGPSNFVARFFVDKMTHLPIMVTWQAARSTPRGMGPRTGSPPPALPSPPAAGPPVETRMYFADYRDVDGVKWPFRIRRAVGSDPAEEMNFDGFRINVKIDPRRFEVKP